MNKHRQIPTVYFFAQTDDCAEFSNFAPNWVAFDDQWWPTVERIWSCSRPMDAKALGMTRRLALRGDREEVRDAIMLSAVRVKVETHDVPQDLLLSTGDAEIGENAPMEACWGCSADGQRLNRLGRTLMQVRGELRDRRGADADGQGRSA